MTQTPARATSLWPGNQMPAAIFFDLDGTVADTATDLAMPINQMRLERGLPAMALAELRPFASMGARGLIGKGLGVAKDDDRFPGLRDEFLARYEAAICVHTRLFDGIGEVLDVLESRQCQWGIVSNKVEKYVRPILAHFGLLERSVAAVGGDTVGVAKPDPAPLLHAAKLARVDPRRCVYVGDDARDVQAGKAAGMLTVAAAYGYCGADDPPQRWGATTLIDTPIQLLGQLGFR
jgi:N-acetyl-D-muramate 6-phosphate phosphatase